MNTNQRRPLIGRNQPLRIGDAESTTPMTMEEKEKSTWTTVAVVAALFFGLLVVAGIIIADVFSGIAAFKTLDCDCNATSPLIGTNELNIDVENTLNDVINTLTEINSCKSLCANGCFRKFYICQTEDHPEDCERRSLILKDCDNFINCLGECSLAFDNCVSSMEEVSDFSGSCINKYNREIICPKG